MSTRKVGIIGVGNVGASYAYAMINQATAEEIVLISPTLEFSEAQARDLSDGSAFLNQKTKVIAGEYSDCKDCDLVCITAGVSIKEGQTRLDIAQDNTNLMTEIVTEVMKSGFDGIFLIATNPVDIMTYVTYKASGLPASRVIGSGTTLDSARFRQYLANYFNINAKHVHAKIIGEHGDSSIPLWSSAFYGPKPILDVVNENPDKYSFEDLEKTYEEARDAGYKILMGKGNTSFGIGLALNYITQAIFGNQNNIMSTSSYLQGEFGHDDVYIGVPSLIGKDGVSKVIDLNLTASEQADFDSSVNTVKEILKTLDIKSRKDLEEEGIL